MKEAKTQEVDIESTEWASVKEALWEEKRSEKKLNAQKYAV